MDLSVWYVARITKTNIVYGSISGKRYLLTVCHILIYDVKCVQGFAKAPAKTPVHHGPSHDFEGRTFF